MHRKKILYITSGSTPYRRAFFRALGKLADVTVLYELPMSKEREWEIEDKQSEGLTEIVLKNRKDFSNCAFCPEVIKYLRNSYDLVIIGGYSTPTGILAILWLRLHKKPYVLNADGGIIKKENRINYLIKRFFISGAAYWLSTGQATNDYLEHYGAKKEKIKIYPFTSVAQSELLNKPLSLEEKREYRVELGIPEDRVLLLVGQFIHRKGFDIMLQACVDLDRSVRIYFVGGVPTEEYIRLKEKDDLANVHFIGFKQKEELKKYYLASDVFVLPTREDIWGLVVNEALAKALPVITTDNCIAGLELIQNGINGFLVPTENASALSEAIKYIINDKTILSEMSENALKSISNYTIENMALAHLQLL